MTWLFWGDFAPKQGPKKAQMHPERSPGGRWRLRAKEPPHWAPQRGPGLILGEAQGGPSDRVTPMTGWPRQHRVRTPKYPRGSGGAPRYLGFAGRVICAGGACDK